MEERFSHQPVLLHETVHHLAVRPGGVYIDCTVGEGGHASAILEASMPGSRLLGIDLDPQALESARRRLQGLEANFILAKGNYARMEELAEDLGFREPDGILLDLGLSSLQLESPGGGFSFQRDQALDMRYDPEAHMDASHIVNSYPFEELARIISVFGQEPRARSIARAITQQRPLKTTLELADLVSRVCGGRRGRDSSGDAHLPGPSHSGELGTGQLESRPQSSHRVAQTRGNAGGNKLPQPGGPASQGDPGPRGQGMHLPSPGPGMHLWTYPVLEDYI